MISEFSLRVSSIHEFAARRRLRGAPVVLFWSHGYDMGRGLATPDQWLKQWPRFNPLVDAMAAFKKLPRHAGGDRS